MIDMEDWKEVANLALLILLILTCVMASIWFLTGASNIESIRQEAIQRGYAEEVYMPNGSKAWRWKE
jgi:hypothetical protein